MEPTLDTDAAFLVDDSAAMKAEEVIYLTSRCGWTHGAACEFVGCGAASEIGEDEPPLTYMPLPAEIVAATEAIRFSAAT